MIIMLINGKMTCSRKIKDEIFTHPSLLKASKKRVQISWVFKESIFQ
jgi:hypothetical protein